MEERRQAEVVAEDEEVGPVGPGAGEDAAEPRGRLLAPPRECRDDGSGGAVTRAAAPQGRVQLVQVVERAGEDCGLAVLPRGPGVPEAGVVGDAEGDRAGDEHLDLAPAVRRRSERALDGGALGGPGVGAEDGDRAHGRLSGAIRSRSRRSARNRSVSASRSSGRLVEPLAQVGDERREVALAVDQIPDQRARLVEPVVGARLEVEEHAAALPGELPVDDLGVPADGSVACIAWRGT